LHIHIITEQESLTFIKQKNTKKRPKPKIEKTSDYNCAYVMVMAVLIIFPVILQTVINLRMLSTAGQRKDDSIQSSTHVNTYLIKVTSWLCHQ